ATARAGGRSPTGLGPGTLADVPAASVSAYETDMNTLAPASGVAHACRLVDAANEFIATKEPWALARDAGKTDQLSQVLFDVAEALRIAAVMLLPVIPRSAAEILRRVGDATPVEKVRLADAAWRNHG